MFTAKKQENLNPFWIPFYEGHVLRAVALRLHSTLDKGVGVNGTWNHNIRSKAWEELSSFMDGQLKTAPAELATGWAYAIGFEAMDLQEAMVLSAMESTGDARLKG